MDGRVKVRRAPQLDRLTVWGAIFLVVLAEAYGGVRIAISLFEAIARELK